MRRFISLFLVFILISSLFTGMVFADEDEIITANVNVYINDVYKATKTVTSVEYPELEYGTVYLFGDTYGTYLNGTVTIDGVNAMWFYFGGTGFVFGDILPNSHIEVNVYYEIEEPEKPAPIEYGTVTLDITDGRNPVPNYEVSFTGIKGAETITETGITNENGVLIISLDKSYSWSFIFNETTPYSIDSFDFYTQLALPNDVKPDRPEIIEGKEYPIYITHYYQDKPGGELVNNVPTNYEFKVEKDVFYVEADTILNTQDYIELLPNYKLGASYLRTKGAGSEEGFNFVVGDEVVISYVYFKEEVITPEPEPTPTPEPEPEPEPEYTVTYIDRDMVLSISTHKAGELTPVIDNPQRGGYRFRGWSPEVVTYVTEDAVYEAQWSRIYYPPVTPSPEPAPAPNPEPSPEPSPEIIEEPEVIIEDEDTPLIETPDVEEELEPSPTIEEQIEIEEEGTPKAEAPTPTPSQEPAAGPAQSPSPSPSTVEIIDEEIPLAPLPNTGDTYPWVTIFGMLFGGTGLTSLGIFGRKRL